MDWVHVVLARLICLGGRLRWHRAGIMPAFLPTRSKAGGTSSRRLRRSMAWPCLWSSPGNDDHRGRIDREDDWQRIAVILIVGAVLDRLLDGLRASGRNSHLFADAKTDRHLLMGQEFPASYFQSINPLLIFLLAPLFSILWTRRSTDEVPADLHGEDGDRPGPARAWAFVIMSQADRKAASGDRQDRPAVAGLGLSAVHAGRALPVADRPVAGEQAGPGESMASLMMAVWFLCTAIANYLAGTLEEMLSHYHINPLGVPDRHLDRPGLMLLALTVPLKKMGCTADSDRIRPTIHEPEKQRMAPCVSSSP